MEGTLRVVAEEKEHRLEVILEQLHRRGELCMAACEHFACATTNEVVFALSVIVVAEEGGRRVALEQSSNLDLSRLAVQRDAAEASLGSSVFFDDQEAQRQLLIAVSDAAVRQLLESLAESCMHTIDDEQQEEQATLLAAKQRDGYGTATRALLNAEQRGRRNRRRNWAAGVMAIMEAHTQAWRVATALSACYEERRMFSNLTFDIRTRMLAQEQRQFSTMMSLIFRDMWFEETMQHMRDEQRVRGKHASLYWDGWITLMLEHEAFQRRLAVLEQRRVFASQIALPLRRQQNSSDATVFFRDERDARGAVVSQLATERLRLVQQCTEERRPLVEQAALSPWLSTLLVQPRTGVAAECRSAITTEESRERQSLADIAWDLKHVHARASLLQQEESRVRSVEFVNQHYYEPFGAILVQVFEEIVHDVDFERGIAFEFDIARQYAGATDEARRAELSRLEREDRANIQSSYAVASMRVLEKCERFGRCIVATELAAENQHATELIESYLRRSIAAGEDDLSDSLLTSFVSLKLDLLIDATMASETIARQKLLGKHRNALHDMLLQHENGLRRSFIILHCNELSELYVQTESSHRRALQVQRHRYVQQAYGGMYNRLIVTVQVEYASRRAQLVQEMTYTMCAITLQGFIAEQEATARLHLCETQMLAERDTMQATMYRGKNERLQWSERKSRKMLSAIEEEARLVALDRSLYGMHYELWMDLALQHQRFHFTCLLGLEKSERRLVFHDLNREVSSLLLEMVQHHQAELFAEHDRTQELLLVREQIELLLEYNRGAGAIYEEALGVLQNKRAEERVVSQLMLRQNVNHGIGPLAFRRAVAAQTASGDSKTVASGIPPELWNAQLDKAMSNGLLFEVRVKRQHLSSDRHEELENIRVEMLEERAAIMQRQSAVAAEIAAQVEFDRRNKKLLPDDHCVLPARTSLMSLPARRPVQVIAEDDEFIDPESTQGHRLLRLLRMRKMAEDGGSGTSPTSEFTSPKGPNRLPPLDVSPPPPAAQEPSPSRLSEPTPVRKGGSRLPMKLLPPRRK